MPGSLPDPSEFDGASALVVAAVTISVSTVFVGLRFWSRALILRTVALEDWFILTALVCHGGEGLPRRRAGTDGALQFFGILSSGTVIFRMATPRSPGLRTPGRLRG